MGILVGEAVFQAKGVFGDRLTLASWTKGGTNMPIWRGLKSLDISKFAVILDNIK